MKKLTLNNKRFLRLKKVKKYFVNLLLMLTAIGAGNNALAAELTLLNETLAVRGFDNLVNVGATADIGWPVTTISYTDYFTAIPTISYYSDGPFNGSPLINETQLIIDSSIEDPAYPGLFQHTTYFYVRNFCDMYPGWSGVMTVKLRGNLTEAKQFRLLNCT